jgi:hypothetical protein
MQNIESPNAGKDVPVEQPKDITSELRNLEALVGQGKLTEFVQGALKLGVKKGNELVLPDGGIEKIMGVLKTPEERTKVLSLLKNEGLAESSGLLARLKALAPAGTTLPDRIGAPVNQLIKSVDGLISKAQTGIAQKFNIDPSNLDLIRSTALGFFANAAEGLAIQFFKFVPKNQRSGIMQLARGIRTTIDPSADMTQYDQWIKELDTGETRTFNDWVTWKDKVAQEQAQGTTTASATENTDAPKTDGTPEKIADKPVTAKLLDGKELKVTLNEKDKKLTLGAADQTKEIKLPESTDMASFTLKQPTKDVAGALDYGLTSGTKISLDPAKLYAAVSEKKTDITTENGIKIPLSPSSVY